MDVMAGTSRRMASRVLALGGATAGCGAAAVALAARAGELGARASAAQVDELVELAVLAAGVLALAWLAGSAALAAACLATRCAGRTWRRGEAWVRRLAPAVVRRTLAVAIAAGLGAGGAPGAFAADGVPTTSPRATATITAEPLDLGWVVTSPVRGPRAGTAVTAPASTPPAPVPARTTTPAPAPTAPAPGPAAAATRTPSPTAPARATTPVPARTPAAVAPTAPASARTATPPGTATGAAPTAPPTRTPSATDPAAAGGPTAPAGTAGSTSPATGPTLATTVTVERGDSLWAIAARHLPAGATDAQIAAAWPAWYHANAAAIGPDPDLIRPGQVLVVPAEVAR